MVKNKIKRVIFLDELPKQKSRYNWKGSIGYIVKFIYGDIKGEVKIVDYKTDRSNQDLYIQYKNIKSFRICIGDFKECQLGKLLGKRTNDFKIGINTNLKDDKRDLTIIDKEYRTNDQKQDCKWYKYKCNKCGYEGWTIEYSLLGLKTGCACCCPTPRKAVEGINDVNTTTPWMTKFFSNPNEAKQYTKGSSHKIIPICPDCGRVKTKEMDIRDIYRLHSIFCSCGDGQSYPSKLMFNVLEQLGVEFETEYNPDWITPRKYDFYFKLNNVEYIVEMDGGFHTNDNNMSGQTKEGSHMIDDYKDDMADRHGIEMIRIDCEKSELEYIKNNIEDSILNKLFDLSSIDWKQAEVFALKNLVKFVCDIKKDNSNMTVEDISLITKLSKSTVRIYLNKGTKLNWCYYNGKEESFEIHSIAGKSFGKPLEMFKDGISLGIFESCAELERQSETLFGIKLSHTRIGNVCTGKWNQYKGYVFKRLS